MKYLLVCLVCFLFLVGCASPTLGREEAAFIASVTALQAENAALKKQIATSATKEDVAVAVKASMIPSEWADLKSTTSQAMARVSRFQRKLDALGRTVGKLQSDVANQPASLSTQFVTRAQWIQLQMELQARDARIKALEAKLAAHGW